MAKIYDGVDYPLTDDTMPISPIEHYRRKPRFLDKFGGWIPQTWLADDNGAKKWLCTRWGEIILRIVRAVKTRDNTTL